MDAATDMTDDLEAPSTAGELRLVRQAILMVSEYGTPRVVVAGIESGNVVLARAAEAAEAAGVRLVPLEALHGLIDIAVEPKTR